MIEVPTWVRHASIGVASVALVLSAVGVAQAQRGGPPPTSGGGAAGGQAPAFGQLGQEYLSDLAANLGVSEDTLRAAMQKTREDMRPQMQQQFGDMWGRFQGGQGGPGFGRRPGAAGLGVDRQQILGVVADALNMTPDDLRQQLSSGKTIAEIARAQGIDPDALADQLTNTLIQEHQGQIHDMIRQAMDRSFTPREGPGRSDQRDDSDQSDQ